MDFLLLSLILTIIISFTVTYTSIPSIINVANQKHLFDEPDEGRKNHSNKIPTLGGIGIFAGVMISSFLFLDFAKFPAFSYAVSAIILLFFTGVKDDIIPLSPRKKLLAQIVAALIVVIKCDIRLTNLYGFFMIEEISYTFSVVISLFTLLVIINSFNLIDGINGLAGGIGIIVSATFAYFFYRLDKYNFVILGIALSGSLLAFLKYNMGKKAQIFMGDTGSLTLGLLTGIFAIRFIDVNHDTGFFFKPAFAPVLVFSILIIPLFDTLRVFILRMSKGKSPFSGDRNHLHHFLIDSGLNHTQASIVLYFANLAFIGLAFILKDINQIVLLVLILGVASLLSLLLFFVKSAKQATVLIEPKIKIQANVNLPEPDKVLEGELSSK